MTNEQFAVIVDLLRRIESNTNHIEGNTSSVVQEHHLEDVNETLGKILKELKKG